MIIKENLSLFAKEHALVADDLERSLGLWTELASDPKLFEQMLGNLSLEKDALLVEALITCCDWSGCHGNPLIKMAEVLPIFALDLPQSTRAVWSKTLADEGRFLDLRDLTTLSDTAAQALGHFHRDLQLDGLTSLSDAAAQALAKQQGDLHLRGLTSLSDAAAQALAKHRCYIYEEGGRLDLDGLTSLSDAAAQALAQHEGVLLLGGLTALSDTAAQALAQHKGELWLTRDLAERVWPDAARHQPSSTP